jgi:hypothetical protein
MPGDIRSFFGGGAKKPVSPKPPAAPEAKAEPKADVTMVDLTDDPPAPASGNKRKAQDDVDVRARSSLRVSGSRGDVLGVCLPPPVTRTTRSMRSETTISSPPKKNRNVRFDRRADDGRVFRSTPPRVV